MASCPRFAGGAHVLSGLLCRYAVDVTAFEHSLLPASFFKHGALLEWIVLVDAAQSRFRARRIHFIQGSLEKVLAAGVTADVTIHLGRGADPRLPATWRDVSKLARAFEPERPPARVRATLGAGLAVLETRVLLPAVRGEVDARDTDAPFVVVVSCDQGKERSRLMLTLWLAALGALAYAGSAREDDITALHQAEWELRRPRANMTRALTLLTTNSTQHFIGFMLGITGRLMHFGWAEPRHALPLTCLACGLAEPRYVCPAWGHVLLCDADCQRVYYDLFITGKASVLAAVV